MSMIIVNFGGAKEQGGSGFITGSVNGQPFGVTFDEVKYQAMKELEKKANSVDTMEELKQIVEEFMPLTQESYKEIVETKSPYIVVNKHTNKFYLKYQDTVSSQPLPQVFVDKIIKSVEKNIDVTPLIKCWARYMRPVKGRPAYSVHEAARFAQYVDADYTNLEVVARYKKEGLADEIAIQFGTSKQVAITQEGLLNIYKVSREILNRYELNEEEEVVQKSRYGKEVDPDTGLVTYKKPEYVEERLFEPAVMGQRGDDFWCGDKKGHFIKVGQVHKLDSWDQVGRPMEKGFHGGNLDYIRGYQTEGTVTHNIFVDPMHVHSVTNDRTGAMTFKQYLVHSSFAGPNKNIYHSSKYAALTDAEFADIVKEAVEATKMAQEEAAKLLTETQSLLDRPEATVTEVFGK